MREKSRNLEFSMHIYILQMPPPLLGSLHRSMTFGNVFSVVIIKAAR